LANFHKVFLFSAFLRRFVGGDDKSQMLMSAQIQILYAVYALFEWSVRNKKVGLRSVAFQRQDCEVAKLPETKKGGNRKFLLDKEAEEY